MYPPGIRKPASMLFSLVLLIFIGEIFIQQTSATFFVEVTQKRVPDPIVTLYECNAEGLINTINDKFDKTTTPERQADNLPTSGQDMICTELKDKNYRKKIYSWVNFYMVADTTLDGGYRIFLQSFVKKGRTRTTLGAASANVSILIGVVIMKKIRDKPMFKDVSQNQYTMNYLQNELKYAPLLTNYLDKSEVKEFIRYLSLHDYETVTTPTDEDVKRFKLFGRLVKQIETVYSKDVRDAKQSGVDKQSIAVTEERVASASRLLNLKLLDPCLFMAGVGGIEVEAKTVAGREAKLQCDNYCKFLAAAFKSNGVTSSKCNGNRDTLVHGVCQYPRCYCEKESYMMRMPEPEKWYTMIECSSDLRIKTAAVVLKSPSLATQSSVRQSFKRSLPASLWKSLSTRTGFGKKF